MVTSIKERLEKLRAKRDKLNDKMKIVQLKIQNICDLCPHTERKRWTNNDGDGQFIVERCLECGKQRDGGLG